MHAGDAAKRQCNPVILRANIRDLQRKGSMTLQLVILPFFILVDQNLSLKNIFFYFHQHYFQSIEGCFLYPRFKARVAMPG